MDMSEIHFQSKSKLDLIKREVEAFQLVRKNLSGVDVEKSNCDCNESILARKIMKILMENEEEGKTGPEQKAFSNADVTKNILRWMSARDLLELRKLSKLWREKATLILLSRDQSFRVEFQKLENFENFTHNAGTLAQFIAECLRHSEIFPCSHFIFNRGRLGDPNLLLFFSKYGKYVEHLGLNPEVVDLNLLRYILMKWTPNLKSLTFQPTSWAEGRHLVGREGNCLSLLSSLSKASESELESEIAKLRLGPRSLPKLRAVTLPKTNSTSYPPGAMFIYEILASAPNLTSIQDPQLSYILQMATGGKISLMNHLEWNFQDNEELALNFHRFVSTGPQLKSMNLKFDPSFKDVAAVSAVSTLFESSQNTLENVTDIQGLDCSDYSQTPAVVAEIPPLPKVTHLEVMQTAGSVFRILPQGQSVSEILPNLKSLHVKVGGAWKELPSPLCAHKHLEKLMISSATQELTFDWVERMWSLYPNIKQLHILLSDSGLRNLPEGLRKIPQFFQQLEQLFIEIDVERHLPDQFKIQMDQALTGLPSDVFERLWNSREPDEEFQKPEILDAVRNAPSVCDLKQLNNLTFEVRFKQRAKPLWSYMAQFYAFQPMEKRQGLEVKVRGCQSLGPLMKGDLGPFSESIS